MTRLKTENAKFFFAGAAISTFLFLICSRWIIAHENPVIINRLVFTVLHRISNFIGAFLPFFKFMKCSLLLFQKIGLN